MALKMRIMVSYCKGSSFVSISAKSEFRKNKSPTSEIECSLDCCKRADPIIESRGGGSHHEIQQEKFLDHSIHLTQHLHVTLKAVIEEDERVCIGTRGGDL